MLCGVFLDCSKCYERVPLRQLDARASEALFPDRLLVLALSMYSGRRHVRVGAAKLAEELVEQAVQEDGLGGDQGRQPGDEQAGSGLSQMLFLLNCGLATLVVVMTSCPRAKLRS